jgi:hypothetical protein
VSSPTLRKLCLPCITARNQSRHQTNKNRPSKTNQRRIVTAVVTDERNVPESLQRFEVAPRTHDIISTTPVVHSSDYSRGNDANHSYEQHQHLETLHPNEKIEEKYDEISAVKTETKPTSSELVSSVLLSSLLSTNEITRSNEDDVVGTYKRRKKKKKSMQVQLI